MALKAILVAALAVSSVLADAPPSYRPPAPAYGAPSPSYKAPTSAYRPPSPSYNAPAPAGPARYDFNYAVKDDYSGNAFGHQETRDGYDTKGTYYAQLPDGRLQKVTYYVNGDSGYVAEVSYQGEAQYSQYQPSGGYKPAPKPGYA
ncbi:pro-resilin-like isoform X3 [Macrobrachium nipponense]|uniref:pro-resilin-like isoform X2 n=1 Tax=Macrobrachium nipponense TaxID=159736 RepID=UPI0030C86BC8